MSHFCVFVVTHGQPSRDELSALLMPFHEFESTGHDQYVQDIDITEKVRGDYESDKRTMLKAPDGSLHRPHEDEFYRDPTEEELKQAGPLGMTGSGFGNGISFYSKDWGDGQGYRPKVRFIPDGYEEVEVPCKELMTFLEFAQDEHGAEKVVRPGDTIDLVDKHKFGWIETNDAGECVKIIDRTNPNRKWDWWSIGGRYAARLAPDYDPEKDEDNYEICRICNGRGRRSLAPVSIEAIRLYHPELNLPKHPDHTAINLLPPEIKAEHGIGEDGLCQCNGCKGTGKDIKWPTQWKDIGNQVRWGDIDRAGLIAKKRNQLGESWDKAEERFKGVVAEKYPDHPLSFGETLREFEEAMTELRQNYKEGDPPLWKTIEADERLSRLRNLVWFATDIYGMEGSYTRADLLDQAPKQTLTCFAILKDGTWHESGEMGWFGMVSNEQEDWPTSRAKILESLSPDDWITVVDCHI